MGRLKKNPLFVYYRKCQACRMVKPVGDFYSHRGSPLDKAYTCKTCNKKISVRKSMEKRGLVSLYREIKRETELLLIKKQVVRELEAGK